MHAVTIAARNYLAMARTLASSFLSCNPGSEFTILVVDALAGEIPQIGEYHIATPHELALPAEEFARMALLYDVTELSTALKPWALELLLDRGAEVAVYLDPDIYVYSSLDNIEEAGREHAILLTPHSVEPMPRDGLRPSEADIMGSGVYNLGFIAVNKRARTMLTWWQQRLRRDCISAPEQMLFTDQRWIDLVPGYYEHGILRDPGCNVAYWNLDARTVSWDGEGYQVDGQPLRFFHFSGYRPETPWILSKYVADRPRILLSERPVVRRLCDDYAARLLAADMQLLAGTPYRFSRLNDSTALTPMMRRAYRDAVIAAELDGAPYPPVPFQDDDSAVRAWFSEPIQPGSWVNRLVLGLWQNRPDLQLAFPDPFGSDQDALLAWCLVSGVREADLDASMLPTAALAAPSPLPISEAEVMGANLAGYFRTETGVGQIGRLLVDAVRAAGLPFTSCVSSRNLSRQQADFELQDTGVRYPVTLATINADQFPSWVREAGPELTRDRYLVGIWAWEVEDFPARFRPAIDLVDEIWAISSFTRDAISAATDKPVHVIPYQVPELPRVGSLDRAALGVGEGDYLLFMFDYFSVFERKNPVGLVTAFTRAFAEGAGPKLVLKSVNGERFRTERERLRQAVGERSDIVLLDTYLDAETTAALMANCLGYVSLHRSEGLGLTMSEAMSAGRPVIATGYSGNLDFMNPENSLLVGYELTEIAGSAGPYAAPTRWAEPDLDEAARHLQWLVEHPQDAAELGLRGQEAMRSKHDLDRTVAFLMARMHAIDAVRTEPELPPPFELEVSSAAERSLAEAQALLDRPAEVSAPSRFGAAATFYRRAVNRLLASHDHQLNLRLNALLSSIGAAVRTSSEADDELASELGRLRGTLATLRAQLAGQQAAVNGTRSLGASLASHLSALADRTDVLSTLTSEGAAEAVAHQQRLDELSRLADQARLELEGNRRQLAELTIRLDAMAARLDQSPEPGPSPGI